MLIVIRQTGTTYDGARDLGRVPLRRASLGSEVEAFETDVAPTGAGAHLPLGPRRVLGLLRGGEIDSRLRLLVGRHRADGSVGADGSSLR